MATIMPASELVRRAAAWLAEQRALYPEKSLAALLDEAGMRFNLKPPVRSRDAGKKRLAFPDSGRSPHRGHAVLSGRSRRVPRFPDGSSPSPAAAPVAAPAASL